jgi:Ca-activated chloride channel family protein
MLLAKLLSPLVCLCISSLCVPAQTQAPSEQPAPPLTKFGVVVIDGKGHSVSGLRKEDLQLFDDGAAETITSFSKEELPLMYGLVIDGSGSLESQFATVIETAKQMIGSNRTSDETFIVKFVDRDGLEMLRGVTSDKTSLASSLSGLKTRPGQTALIDALYVAADYATKHAAKDRRSALVLISDGEDRASYYKEEDLFKLLDKSRLQVFAIGLVSKLDDDRGFIRKSPRQTATNFLVRLTQKTGGRLFLVKSPNEISETVSQITTNLRTEYVISYQPTKRADKVARRISVKLVGSPDHENWTVITHQLLTAKN